jgi:Peptidase family M48
MRDDSTTALRSLQSNSQNRHSALWPVIGGLRALVTCAAVISTPAVVTSRETDPPASQIVLGFFQSHANQDLDAFLESLRPAPLDAAARAEVLAGLPTDGTLPPSAEEQRKIAAARRLLAYCARDGVITFKVIELNHAFLGLYFRTVILVSRKLFNLVDADEFVALVAHEVGHDFDWDEYWTAMQRHDHARMQQLELRSDGIAVLTLRRLRVDPEHLVSAVQRVTLYNQRHNATARAEDYVSLSERLRFLRAVAKLVWSDSDEIL